MLRISVLQYRVVCVLALTTLALYFAPRIGLVNFDHAVATARTWRYFGYLLPLWALQLYAWTWFAAFVLSLIGLIGFWRISRWLLVAALLSAAALRPFLGLVVYSAYEAFIACILGYAVLWLVTVSFWSPIAEQFQGKQAKDAT